MGQVGQSKPQVTFLFMIAGQMSNGKKLPYLFYFNPIGI